MFRWPIVGFRLPLMSSTTWPKSPCPRYHCGGTVLISQNARPLTCEVKVLDRDSQKRYKSPDLLLQPVKQVRLCSLMFKLMILLSGDTNLYREINQNIAYNNLNKSGHSKIWPCMVKFSTPKLQTFEICHHFCFNLCSKELDKDANYLTVTVIGRDCIRVKP